MLTLTRRAKLIAAGADNVARSSTLVHGLGYFYLAVYSQSNSDSQARIIGLNRVYTSSHNYRV